MVTTDLSGGVSNVLTVALDKFPEPYGIKDLESRIVYANPALIALFGVKSVSDVVGKFDHEIKSKLVQFDNAAEEFQKQDKQVIDTKCSLVTLEIHPKAIDHPFIVRKVPLLNNEGECIGIIGHNRNLEICTLNDYVRGSMPGSLLLNRPDDTFSERECEIIFFRLQGLKSRVIGNIMYLSCRTIENSLQRMYNKAGVNHIDDFRAFCEEKNYHRYLPRRFINRVCCKF